jgi:hypothetical protein
MSSLSLASRSGGLPRRASRRNWWGFAAMASWAPGWGAGAAQCSILQWQGTLGQAWIQGISATPPCPEGQDQLRENLIDSTRQKKKQTFLAGWIGGKHARGPGCYTTLMGTTGGGDTAR